tara:strand:- start:43 stop:483 length:441 start_codon:yes stop_codon:yes gene_type:complete
MPVLDFTNLITLITAQHETQKEFCEALQIKGRRKGISRSTMLKWRRRDGEVDLATMISLCEHFGVERHVLDLGCREINEKILTECLFGIQSICEEAGKELSDLEDRAFWITRAYRARMAAKDSTEYKKELKRVLETNVIPLRKRGE